MRPETRPEPSRALAYLALAGFGCAWGLTLPLTRIAVSTGHPPLGLLLWQQVFMVAILLPLVWASGRGMPAMALSRHGGLFALVALLGSVLPGYFSYLTAADMPAGVRAVVIAIVPMFALPIAILCRIEKPEARRAVGVLLGALAILLIALPAPGSSAAVGIAILLLALIVPLSYGVEANYLAWRGSDGLHPFQLLLGASVFGIAFALPLAIASGQLLEVRAAWGRAEWAMLAASLLNALAYSGYLWLITRAGAVFASQISYLVTAFGVVWSMLLLGETYSWLVWAAFGLMLAGIALVRPAGATAKNP